MEQRNNTVRIILVSHGNLAEAMLENVEMLMGPQKNLAAYGLKRDGNMEEFKDLLRRELSAHGQEGVIFISDLMNGTPCNTLLMLTREYPGLYHITGMNLAAVIGCLSAVSRHPDAAPEEICEKALAKAQEGIQDVRKALEAMDL